MEKLVTEIVDFSEQTEKSKAMVRGQVKDIVKYSKIFKAIQFVKKYVKEDSYKFIKRTIDIVVGTVGTTMLLPIVFFVKIGYIMQGDFAPVIFKQERIGKDGKSIYIYKIRSMVHNAEAMLERLMEANPEIKKEYLKNKKLEHDPRITKIGAFIRKTSLDEFGQFINILKGNMSLIGPRPYLIREKKDMGEYYNDVIQNKPGLTGLWQARGRSDVGFQNRCRLDRFYYNNKGIWFDIKIVWWTIGSVLHSKGAK